MFTLSRPWAFWRRVQYGSAFGALVAFGITMLYFFVFYVPPSCTDGAQNGDETGVDCGGACRYICASTLMPPSVLWAKSFEIVPGQYNVVAYIENRNLAAAAPTVSYTFRLQAEGKEVAVVRGRTILPPGSTYPVFAGRVVTEGGAAPTETILELEPVTAWLPATMGREQFRTTDIALSGADRAPRLRAFVENMAIADARNVEVVATIFNAEGIAVTASQTIVDELPGQQRREVYFTWPQPIAKTVRSCEVPSDVMIVLDRSGSMAADGGTPPEPLESAKRAAQSFVNFLQPRDRFGFLSYATTPSTPLEQTLTDNRAAVLLAIGSTTMGRDGTQYTNMGDAFSSALAELTSTRHRDDARKVIVFLTDGDVTRPVNPETGRADREYAAQYAREAAARAKAAGVIIYSIGFGDFLAQGNAEVERDTALIRELASGDTQYFEAPTVADLERVYREIATDICEVGPARIEVIPKTDSFTN